MTKHLSPRNSNVEVLRYVLMIAICIWHTLVHGYNLKMMGEDIVPSSTSLILMSLLAPATYTFMLISGYYGITLKVKKMFSFILQCNMYYWLCLLFLFFFSSVCIMDVCRHPFAVSSNVWWFVTNYVIIMLISPFINSGIEKVERRKYKYILICLLFISSIGLYLSNAHTGSDFLGLLIVYLIGRYMGLHKQTLKRSLAVILWVVPTSLLVILCIVGHKINQDRLLWHLFNYCNPLIILQSVGIMYFVISLKIRNNIFLNWLGAHCFAIYLITEKTNKIFYIEWAKTSSESFILCLCEIIGVSMVIMLLDTVMGMLNKKITDVVVKDKKVL